MLTTPIIQDQAARPYAYIDFTVTMAEMKKAADEGFPALFAGLAKLGVAPIAAPFFNYRRIDMARTLDIEVGVPVDRVAAPDGAIKFGELPAGKYAAMTHTGHYDGLYDATAMLIGWAKERGIAWDVVEKGDGDHFACRLEIYETDPSAEPDPAKWETRLLFKTAG
ncbi:GyrI-like domain-containing protein [Devosia beringensis]|uniref:GyrI-like domain-containing protein n=1 Tax=Devosia beringensis TaxID=2657486 RepID=UPI00186B8537|nr:GyrI-like domain-containing protein [Devosia beringensis]